MTGVRVIFRRMERHKAPKTGRRKSLAVGTGGGGAAFYGGNEVQSAQALFSSLSATNIVSGASDIQLDTQASRGIYINRGFEPQSSAQQSTSAEHNENPYRPIEIKSQQKSAPATTSFA